MSKPQSSIDLLLQADSTPKVPKKLLGLWGEAPPVVDLSLPSVPENRPIPTREDVEARIPAFREETRRTRHVVLVVDNLWAGEFDPVRDPLSSREALLDAAVQLVKALPTKVKLVASLTGPYLLRVEGKAERVLPLLDGGVFREVTLIEHNIVVQVAP